MLYGKGLYPLAIDSFNSVMEKIGTKDESYWGVKYELAEAYEKMKILKRRSGTIRKYTGGIQNSEMLRKRLTC